MHLKELIHRGLDDLEREGDRPVAVRVEVPGWGPVTVPVLSIDDEDPQADVCVLFAAPPMKPLEGKS